jgi:hypothetical protein
MSLAGMRVLAADFRLLLLATIMKGLVRLLSPLAELKAK